MPPLPPLFLTQWLSDWLSTLVLDLRQIIDEDSDYANPIEPSAHGGEKMAKAISQILLGIDDSGNWVYERQ